jgi:hypothetical protein
MELKTIDQIINEVVIEKNKHWLNEEEAIDTINEDRLGLSKSDVKEIINRLPIIIYGDNTTVDITSNGIVVKPSFPNN